MGEAPFLLKVPRTFRGRGAQAPTGRRGRQGSARIFFQGADGTALPCPRGTGPVLPRARSSGKKSGTTALRRAQRVLDGHGGGCPSQNLLMSAACGAPWLAETFDTAADHAPWALPVGHGSERDRDARSSTAIEWQNRRSLLARGIVTPQGRLAGVGMPSEAWGTVARRDTQPLAQLGIPASVCRERSE